MPIQTRFEPILKIRELTKSFGKNKVLTGVSFDVYKEDVISIIGASGSGKSTLLRCINLLENPTSGEIVYRQDNVLTGQNKINDYRARVGMVFQSFNLFDNMTVLDHCVRGQVKGLKRSS